MYEKEDEIEDDSDTIELCILVLYCIAAANVEVEEETIQNYSIYSRGNRQAVIIQFERHLLMMMLI